MQEQVVEVCRTKAWAELQLKQYAATIKAMDVTDYMGVKLRRFTEGRDEYWQVVLVDRREK